jgi:hypothetical protein
VVSTCENRKSTRFENKSTIILANEHFDHFYYAQVLNFSSGGLYFKSDVAFKPGTKVRIQFENQPFQSGPKTLSSVVRWCRELYEYDSDYNFGVGVKFI